MPNRAELAQFRFAVAVLVDLPEGFLEQQFAQSRVVALAAVTAFFLAAPRLLGLHRLLLR